MGTRDDLIGIWSADALYAPGAQGDTVLVLKLDGTGRFEWLNWTLCSADLFRWHIPAPGRLTIVGYKTWSVGDGKHVVEGGSDFACDAVPYDIVTRATPIHGTLQVLRITLGKYMPDEYDLIRRDFAGYEEPVFD